MLFLTVVFRTGLWRCQGTDAFVLTFRFFIQKNDRTSFRSLSEGVLDDPNLSTEWKHEFTRIRDELNQYLDAQPDVRLIRDGFSPTRREIMRMFIYGDLAHSDEKLLRELSAWKDETFMFPLLEAEFNSILIQVFGAIDYIARLSGRELDASP